MKHFENRSQIIALTIGGYQSASLQLFSKLANPIISQIACVSEV